MIKGNHLQNMWSFWIKITEKLPIRVKINLLLKHFENQGTRFSICVEIY